jgi:hypothetical protein
MVRGEMSGTRASSASRRIPWLVRAILAAMLVALLVPALAAAQTAAPAAPEEAPPAIDLDVLLGGEPAAEAPAPAEPAPAPVAEEPAEEPAPAPPPAAEEPAAPPAPPEAVQPPAPAEPAPPVVPAAEGPAVAPAPVEAIPGPTVVVPVLPVDPDGPRVRADAVLGPVTVSAGDLPKAPPGAPVVKLGGPTAPSGVALASLGAPTAPPDVPGVTPAAGPDPPEAASPPPRGAEFSSIQLEPARPVVTPSSRDGGIGGPTAAEEAAQSDHNPFAELTAPGGPAPAGSSLLAVLASYVLPGSGSLPATTLLLFVQLAVLLALALAPRLGRGEPALALGRLGPRSGYRTVLARPG